MYVNVIISYSLEVLLLNKYCPGRENGALPFLFMIFYSLKINGHSAKQCCVIPMSEDWLVCKLRSRFFCECFFCSD